MHANSVISQVNIKACLRVTISIAPYLSQCISGITTYAQVNVISLTNPEDSDTTIGTHPDSSDTVDTHTHTYTHTHAHRDDFDFKN